MHFDWHTEEERLPQWLPQGEGRPARRRMWITVLIAGLLLALASYGIWRQVQRGLAAAEQSARESVHGVHDLAGRAAAEADEELLVSLLSGRDPAWTTAQKKRLRSGLLFSGAVQPFGLRPAGESAVTDVEFDPELLEATVSAEQGYVVTQTTGITEHIVLRGTHFYRQGAQRWLLSPPPEGFWGDTKTARGTRLTLSFPERDETTALRLAQDIDEKLGEMCAMLSDLDCPPGFTMKVELSADPASFLSLEPIPSASTELTLPTPTLVGVPVDEEGYQALFRGYAARVAAAGITSLVEYDCCRRVLFFKASLDWQLYHLGLQGWPLTVPRYLAAIDSLAGPAWFQMLWYRESLAERPPAERALALGAVELLLDDGPASASPPLLQRTLLTAGIPGDWLQLVSKYRSLPAFYQVLQSHLMEQANERQTFPPPPDQDLILSCYADGTGHLYRYHPDTGRLAEEPAERESTSRRVPLPESEGAPSSSPRLDEPIVFLQRREEPSPRRPERKYVFRPDIFSQVYSTLDAKGRFIAMQIMAYGPQLAFVPISGEQCGEQCPQWQNGGAYAVHSPDGQDILWQQGGRVWRGEGDQAHPVGRGSFPFWLDRATYGYLSREEVVIARTADDVAQPLFTVEALLDRVRSRQAPDDRGRVTAVQGDPAGSGAVVFFLTLGPGQNYLLLLRPPEHGSSWFERRPQLSDLAILFDTKASIDTPPESSFSPGGKWFVATTGFSGDGPPGRVVFDLREPRTPGDVTRMIAFAPGRYHVNYDWSAGDAWLAWPRQNYVELLAPASGTARYFVSAPTDGPAWQWCESVAWVNE